MADSKYTMAELIEQERIKVQQTDADSRQHIAQGLMILAGMGIVGTCAVFGLRAISDSDMTDALQECGRVRIVTEAPGKIDGEWKIDAATPLIESCRKLVFDHYKGP